MGLYGNNELLLREISAIKERCRIPGLAIGILCGGDSLLHTDGVINANNPVPVDADTLFQIASITKTFNALLVMLLCGKGRVSLDTTIKSIAPDFAVRDKDAGNRATVRHILTHTGGWEGEMAGCPDKGEDSLKELMKSVAELPQLTPLGKIWGYNSVGFCILGYALECLLGLPYEKIIHDTVLAPLGMGDSVFAAGDAILRKAAVGHYVVDGEVKVAAPWGIPRAMRPSGGLVTSLNDMLRYLRFLLALDNPPVFDGEDAMLREMFARQCAASGPADAVGLSWMIRYINGEKIIRHGGASLGQYSEILFIPERKFGFVILLNGDDDSDSVGEIAAAILREYTGLPYRRTFPEPAKLDLPALQKYQGCYRGLTEDIDIVPSETGLTLTYSYKKIYPGQTEIPAPPPPMHAVFYAADRAYIEENQVMCDFFAGDSGEVAFLRHGNKVLAKSGS